MTDDKPFFADEHLPPTMPINLQGPISQLLLSADLQSRLRNAEITHVADLLQCPTDRLESILGISRDIRYIDDALAEHGLVRGPFYDIGFLNLDPQITHHLRVSHGVSSVAFLKFRLQRNATFTLSPTMLQQVRDKLAIFEVDIRRARG